VLSRVNVQKEENLQFAVEFLAAISYIYFINMKVGVPVIR